MVIVLFIKKFVLLLFILIMGVLGMNAATDELDYPQISGALRASIASSQAKRHGMAWIGTSASMMDCIKMTGMSYKIYRPLDKAEARRLIVDCVEEYLTAINASKEIRPFLENYPATAVNIHIAIYSYTPDRRKTYDPYIGTTWCQNGIINYYTNDIDNEYRYKSETKQSYEVALAIVRKEAEMRAANP